MKDYLYLGPVPCDEDCAQVGDPDYRKNAIREMKAYINQLEREFPDWERDGVEFRIVWQNHDFGAYGEVVVDYNDADDASTSYAFEIESNLPYNWDEEARKELGYVS
jgi:hypothetical protein